MSELPVSWAWTTIDEIASTSSGGTPSRARTDFYGGSIPWVKSGELNNGVVSEIEETITNDGLKNSSAKIFPAGTLCIALYGATVGKVGILSVDAATNQAVCGISPNPGINIRYLFYFLQSQRSALIGMSVGGAQPNISQQIVRSTKVPVCAYTEQDRIVDDIETQFTRLTAATDALKQVQSNLKRYRASVLKAASEGRLVPIEAELARKEDRDYEPADKLLQRILRERRACWEADTLAKMQASGKAPKDDQWKQKYKEASAPSTANLPPLPEGWCWASWDQLSNWVTYGFTRPVPHVTEGIPIVTARHISGGRINFEECDLAPEEVFRSLSDKDRPAKGDILITKDGTIGRAGIVETKIDFCINQSVGVIWLRSCVCDRQYLLAIIEAPLTQRPIEEKARGVAIKHLSITDFAKMPVPLAPLFEQNRIGQAVADQTLTIARTQEVVSARLLASSRLRQSVLSAAFSGQLVPQDPTDESASALLERIRAHRQSIQTQKSEKRTRQKPSSNSVVVSGVHE